MNKCLQGTFKAMDREAIIEYVNSLPSIFDPEKKYVYKLSHTYDIEPTPLYVESNIIPEAMDLLIMYFQLKMWDIDEVYAFGQEDAVPILCSLYGAKQINTTDKYDMEIDLYINWEKWCGLARTVRNMEMFDCGGLQEALEAIEIKY